MFGADPGTDGNAVSTKLAHHCEPIQIDHIRASR
jgi:hypothetical protein